jgi:hypothetical protein
MATEPGTKVVHSDPTDPNKTVTTTMRWYRGYEFMVIPSTPGIYTVTVNGIEVLKDEIYDYRGGGGGRSCEASPTEICLPGLESVKDGETVTVTVTAQHATGPWLAEMRSKTKW